MRVSTALYWLRDLGVPPYKDRILARLVLFREEPAHGQAIRDDLRQVSRDSQWIREGS